MIKKYSKPGSLVGLGLVLLGLVVYSVNSLITTFSLVLLILGTILLVGSAIVNFKELKEGLSSRSAKFGSNAALMIVFLLGILIVVNILLSKLNARIDTTAAKQFSLAPQTKKVLNNLESEIKATGFFKTGEDFRAKELFLEYSNVSPRFKYEIVDPDKKPGLAKRYSVKKYGTIVVQGKGKEQKITESTEEELTNALITVSREGVNKLYFTTGHGEKDYESSEKTGLESAKTQLEEENYTIEKILLAEQDSIPNDATALIIAGPKTDLFPNEIDMINNYMKNGGKLLVMIDPDTPASYDELINRWGLDAHNDIVIDASGIGQLFGAGPIMPIVSDYEDHQLTKDFNVMTFFNEARSITKAKNTPTGMTITEIAKTNPRSWGETGSLAAGNVQFDEGSDIKGPLTIFAVGEMPAANPDRQTENKFGLDQGSAKARIAVFGDSDFASNGFFKNQGNGDLFMNTVSWLAEEEDLISVRAKDPEDRRLNLTKKQSRIILYLGVVLFPVLIFATGIAVYTRRK